MIQELLLAAVLLFPQGRALAASKPVSMDPGAMDPKADPCADFYRYACGGWLDKNQIPPDQSRWGRFNELAENNREILRGILEAASRNDPKRDATDAKIGDFYAACMDEAAVEKAGYKPLEPILARIASLSSPAELPALLARLHRLGVGAAFALGSGQDFKDATQVIAQLGQGGLGLPDRDYYLRTGDKDAALRARYEAHVRKMFELLKDAPASAAEQARIVLAVETRLARASQTREALRDPVKTYHKMPPTGLAELAPVFGWSAYLKEAGAGKLDSVNVESPDFIREFGVMVASVPLAEWTAYLRWHAVRAAAPLLSSAFVDENFDFYGKTLTGAKELKPRWKRCVALTDGILGEALGKRYVEKTFGKEGKQKTLEMIAVIERGLGEDIRELPWMTEPTKKEALVKLGAIANKMGYPDHWRDYGKLLIARDDLLGDVSRGGAFEFQRQLDKIGKPVDRGEWLMSPPTVNAYYDPSMNDINFPAGILQPPFYDKEIDDAVNFGAIGAVIGHELTHGFDDEGRQFDEKGNLRDWWTPADAKAFQQRADCFVAEYSSFTAVDDVKLNGRATLGENTADNGGIRVAYRALKERLPKRPPSFGDLSPEQRFFLGYGQVWCTKITDEEARRLAYVDYHSPARYRVNGVLSNVADFAQAFGCKAGAPMVRPDPCRVW